MSLKWTGSNSESGILRRSEFKEKKEELFVFGYSCKLFRDDDKAQHIDQGKHLIPWMGDETLKIDRYDARGALHDLSRLEAPPGGYDWRVELTRGEQDVELLCDEERYRALHTDEDEEEMYKEEELKRLHAAGYGQVSFNYDTPAEPSPAQPAEVDEPFEPTNEFKALLPADVVLPDGVKQNAIIEKTALFIEKKGPQMEILIKAKQQDNPQFQFLNKDAPLHTYYTALIGLVKTGKWPKKIVEPVVEEEKPPESEEYLHPSLSTIIESAPSIPSIHYKPSADCDYTLLISKMRGEPILDESYPPVLAPGEVAPPGTEPLPPRANAEISRAPVMYNQQADTTAQAQAQLAHYQQYAAYYQQYMAQQAQPTTKLPPRSLPLPQSLPQTKVVEKEGPVKSTGLSLMKNYNTDSDSDSDSEDSSSTASKGKPAIPTPPEDVKVVIDKMAAYVARNGDDFENIVRAKNDPRFMFLEPENEYHAFYRKLMQEKRGGDVNGKGKEAKATAPTVCFSIKKHKEPEPILPKPALPYESSSDEESEDKHTKQAEEPPPQTNIPPVVTVNNSIPPVVVYKMEASQANSLPIVKAIEAKPAVSISNQTINKPPVEYKEPPKETTPIPQVIEQSNKVPEIKKYRSLTPTKEDKYKEEEYRKEKKRHKEKKKERERDRKIEKESRKSERRSVEREREREKRDRVIEREKRERHEKRKYNKEELDSEIITLEESEEFIDLTGDMPEPKDESEADRQRKLERRQKAAEFLRRAGVEPGTLPAGSLASAMVDTLETIRRKKEEEEEKRRRREKKRQKERRAYDDEYEKYHRKSKRRRQSDSESDYDGSKRKKRKKDKKSSKSKKKRAHSESPLDYTEDSQVPIDISSTLKELRSNTPTKDLINDLEDTQHSYITRRDTSSDSEEDVVKRDRMSEEKSEKRKTKSKPREYSEGEWSSDSDEDSESTGGKYE